MARKVQDLEHIVLICAGKDCRKRGADSLRSEAKSVLRQCGVFRRSLVLKTKCAGQCDNAPIVCHQPSNTWLTEATPKRLRQLLVAAIE